MTKPKRATPGVRNVAFNVSESSPPMLASTSNIATGSASVRAIDIGFRSASFRLREARANAFTAASPSPSAR